MKKTLFSASEPGAALRMREHACRTEKPAAPSVQTRAPGRAPLAARPVPAAPQVDLSKRSVFYEYDKYDIRDEYRPVLQAHGKYLAENPRQEDARPGNCDERGSREYNIALGQRRAEG